MVFPKLSEDGIGKGLMPSRSSPATPRNSLGAAALSSGIPRFVRNPKARSLAGGAVHRRLAQKQAASPLEEEASAEFSRDKSRSSSSLSALRDHSYMMSPGFYLPFSNLQCNPSGWYVTYLLLS